MSTPTDVIRLPSPQPRLAAIGRIRFSDYPVIPLTILAIIAFVAIFANQLAPHNPEVGILSARFKPPFWLHGGSTEYLLGTDQLGRDVLSRLLFGARISLVVGFTAVIFAGAVGTFLGILSGYLGGWVDQVVMRITDTWLALPALTFAIFLAAIVGPSMWNIVIIAEATLSFLGVGVPPPQPAWGLMLADGKQGLMVGYWWLTVFPGLGIMLLVLSANLLGDWLRVRLDPQLRQL